MITFNSYLRKSIEQYVDLKHNLGFKFEAELGILKKLDSFLIERKEEGPGISKEFAEFWYHAFNHLHPRTKYAHCILLREFCGYLANMGIKTYCPRVPQHPKSSFVPYIFSHNQIEKLIKASDKLTNCYHHSANGIYAFPAILRVQYSTGLRIGETLSLNDDDVDLEEKTIRIRPEITKNGLERIIPIGDSLVKILRKFKMFRDSMLTGFNHPKTFFSLVSGDPIARYQVESYFRLCLRYAEIPYLGKSKGPRLHDLRHTFACHALANMCDQGLDIYVCLPILSTYLGHKNTDATNWYVRLTAEVFPSVIEKVNKTCIDIFPHYRSYDYEKD